MLEVVDIHTYYGNSHVLHGISLKVEQGSIVALLGRNGMGKTTVARSIIGFTPPRRGVVRFKEKEIGGLEPYQIARMGLSLVPQGRGIFSSLSVKENLTIAARSGSQGEAWNLDRVYSLFPILKDRANLYANLLSGGEQQMLSIGRALMTNPDLLLMDEPSEGLAPLIVREISRVIDQLRGSLSVLLAEQNLQMALGLADYVYVISKGTVVYESTPQELRNNEEVKSKHLGV
ncbi:High-affinity branched-chain amino acid transport ATP-binding protein LivF [subsurface metagenome]